jgi:hypothetical protein
VQSLRGMRIAIALFVLTVATDAFAQTPTTTTTPSPPPAPYPAPGGAYPTPTITATAPYVRQGLTFGIGLGVGSLVADCEECDSSFEAGGLHGHVGVMVSPRLAILGEAWAMAHSNGFLTVYQNLATIAARAWLTPQLWVQGGVGAATAGYRWRGFFVDREDRTESSPGITAAVGYELPIRPNMALDLQLRAGTGFYDKDPVDGYVVKGHSVALGAGLAWY